MNNKYKNINNSVKNILGHKKTIDDEMKNFCKNLRLFSKYYFLYQQSSDILEKYEGNDKKLSEKLSNEDLGKIQKQISELKAIRLKEIYDRIVSMKNQSENNDGNEIYESNENNNQENIQKDLQIQIKSQEILNREEFLKERAKELQEIHKTSAQIKEMTQHMAMQVNDQGEKLELIENNVQNALENAEAGKKEIQEADKTSKKNRKKLCCFIFIIAVSIGGISAIVLSLIFGK